MEICADVNSFWEFEIAYKCQKMLSRTNPDVVLHVLGDCKNDAEGSAIGVVDCSKDFPRSWTQSPVSRPTQSRPAWSSNIVVTLSPEDRVLLRIADSRPAPEEAEASIVADPDCAVGRGEHRTGSMRRIVPSRTE